MKNWPTIYFNGETFGKADLSWIGLMRAGDLLILRSRFKQKSPDSESYCDHYQFSVYKEVDKTILKEININCFTSFNELTPAVVSEMDLSLQRFTEKNQKNVFFEVKFLLNLVVFSSEAVLFPLRFVFEPNSLIQYYSLI